MITKFRILSLVLFALALGITGTATTSAEPLVYQEENGPRTFIPQWNKSNSNANDPNERIARSDQVGDTVTLPFTGTEVTWFTEKGPDMGKARVWIDGVNKGIINLAADNDKRASIKFKGLGSGRHTLTITVLEALDEEGDNKMVKVDGFAFGRKVVQEDYPLLTYNSWKGVKHASASGGSYVVSTDANTSIWFLMKGTQVTWYTAVGPAFGKARVSIDGVAQTIDLYSPSYQWKVAKTFTGNFNDGGGHSIVVQPLYEKNPQSTGYGVVVDAFSHN